MAVHQEALIAGGRGLVSATSIAYRWLGSYGNPARQRALRFVQAFAAHDISSNQIADLDHPCRRLSASQLGDVRELMKVLEPEHLDWASQLLWIDRSWLSSGDGKPHREHDYNTSQLPSTDLPSLVEWLEARLAATGRDRCRIRAYSTVHRVPDDLDGAVTVVYEEDFEPEGAGGRERLGRERKRRYVVLAHNWVLDDPKGLVNVATIFAAARRVGLFTSSSIVSPSRLRSCEDGKVFISGFRPRGPMLPYISGGAVGFKRMGYIHGNFEGENLVTGYGYRTAPWFDEFRALLTDRLQRSRDVRLVETLQDLP